MARSNVSFAQEAQTPYKIALERIAEAEANGATGLMLARLGLTELSTRNRQLEQLARPAFRQQSTE
jgi:hypothetical protein